jgi:hypothetical protein
MKTHPKNVEIYKQIFNWVEIEDINEDSVRLLAENMGISLSRKKITIKSDWKTYKMYRIVAENDDVIFYIKELWERGAIREILGLKLGAFLDPHLLPSTYLFGQYYPQKLKSGQENEKIEAVPFVATMTVPGSPLKKKDVEQYPFLFGRQYTFCRWLSLYDCNERHFFLGPDGFIRRIDFGLSFSDLVRPYQGFDLFVPKTLFKNMEFKRGAEFQKQLSFIRFEAIYDDLLSDLDKMNQLKEDDLFDLKISSFKKNLIEYWKREGFLDVKGRPKSVDKFILL